MSKSSSIIKVTESALGSLSNEGDKIEAWIAKYVGVKMKKPTLLDGIKELLELTDGVLFWVDIIDTLKNRYITKFGNSLECRQLLEVWKSVASLTQTGIIKMLDACYSYYMMGSKWESVLVNAWNETKLIIKCPRCESEDLHEYAQPPYLGYPLVYEHICKESSEARRYQAIFPYVIHKLTTCKEEPVGTPDPGTIQPIGYQLHPSGKYWVTVGKGFRTAWWQLDPGTPRSRPQKEEEVESLSEKLGGLLLTNNNPKSDSPERSSPRSSKLEFDLVETIRSLSDANEKRIEKLYSFQQILEVYGEDGPSDPITWRIISSTSMRDEWICEKQTGCNKTLIRTTTKPNKGVRAASLARRGQPFNNLVTFSGAGPEPDLVSKTIFISLHSEISDFFDADRPERFPYPDLDLRDWAIELSEIVEMKYDGHEMLWWNTLDGIRNFECSHTEKKTIVWYLIVRGIRHPKEMEGTMLKAKHKQNHILRLYGSQAPCKWCIEFLEKVTKQFSKSGLCIGWRNIPEEEKAKRPGPSTQGEIERPNTAERGGKSSPSASMTYINVCGLGADITWPALPVVPTPGST